MRVRFPGEGGRRVVNGRGRGRTLTLALSQRERGFLVLRRARDFPGPHEGRGGSSGPLALWERRGSEGKGDSSAPQGRGGGRFPLAVLREIPERGGWTRGIALWERVRVRVFHQGYAKVSQGAKARAKGNRYARLAHMDMRSRARELRRASTDAERAFWRQVRDRGLGGHKFRRQVPIGPYIADFLCLQARLIIEFDGGHHQEQTAADERRTQWLESEGYRVLRIVGQRCAPQSNRSAGDGAGGREPSP